MSPQYTNRKSDEICTESEVIIEREHLCYAQSMS